MQTIRLTKSLPDKEVDKLAGTLLDESHFDTLIDFDCDVFKPNGQPLLFFRRNVIPSNLCKNAWVGLRSAAASSDNRGNAGGVIEKKVGQIATGNEIIGKVTRTGFKALKLDGTISATSRANQVNSGIVGYFDKNPRYPYCRTTAFNLAKPEKFLEALPLIRFVDKVFRENAPERYKAQKRMIEMTHSDFFIHSTVFTTITVNKNWRTATHKDAGDYAGGFGVMSALRAGHYKGCYLCFPKYRVAIDLRTSDVALADVHEWHGNTAFLDHFAGKFERISLIFYYRENMYRCGSAEEELNYAKHRKLGQPLFLKGKDEAG